MKPSWKNVLASLAAIVTIGLALLYTARTNPDSGIELGYSDGQLEVVGVQYGSPAQRDGVLLDTVVASLNGEQLLAAPAWRKEAIADDPPQIESIVLIEPDSVAAVMAGQAAMPPTCDPFAYCSDDGGMSGYVYGTSYWYPGPSTSLLSDIWPLGLGLLILIGGWRLLSSGRLGETLRPFAVTLPVATAMPLLLIPIDLYPAFSADVVESVLLAAGTLPLALSFAGALGRRRSRVATRLLVLALAGLALATGLLVPWGYSGSTIFEVPTPADVRFVLVALTTFIPGLLAARPNIWAVSRGGAGVPPPPGKFVESTELAVAALTPGIAAFSLIGFQYQTWPILVWLIGIFVVRRYTLTPLLRLASRTRFQRDLVVSATEAERARIAADIHDYALQDLTMLVRRLDAAGDAENAAAAREVSDRLRVICGDLRLPVLDDLGVGPALEWLVDRYEATAGKIGLERLEEEKRLPADVELAFFRVAQEAIANAVHHGAPPVLVRYRGGGHWAELEVDDGGNGLPAGAAEKAERTGHLGLMNMTQRAETIGGNLSIGRRPGGGTRVRLVWEAQADTVDSGAVAGAEPLASSPGEESLAGSPGEVPAAQSEPA